MSDEVNEPLLTCQPPAPQSSLTGADLTPGAKVTLILEAEQEIRALERDLRDIETLAERDVVGAGRLAGARPCGVGQWRSETDKHPFTVNRTRVTKTWARDTT